MRTVLRGIESKTVYPAKEQRYRGENGELLEVVSDLTSFNRSPAAWKEHFDEQKEKPAFIRYKDVLLPDLPEKCITSLSEGDTPLYPATKAMRDYFGVEKLELKHEGKGDGCRRLLGTLHRSRRRSLRINRRHLGSNGCIRRMRWNQGSGSPS